MSRRRVLRALQLVVGVWTTLAVVGLFTAGPAAADNCSVFTDCFGVANSALEAAFGLALLAVLSMVLDFVPGVGTVKGIVEAGTGRDLLTGQELEPWERALGVLPLVGGLAAVAGLSRIGRAGRGARMPGEGTRYPYSDPKVQQYRRPTMTPSQRARLSERIGEDGGLTYVRDVAGNRKVTILRPTSAADVRPLVERMKAGVPWDHAVAYNGRNVTNIVYFDGRNLHVIEAKGGDGVYGDRASTLRPGTRIRQDDPDYPRDVAADMRRSRLSDGRREISSLIRQAYKDGIVRYVGVRTGPRGELLAGNPETVVEHVFKEPPP
ncbi:hypothetical protein Cfla_2525 [Cellulomonas flavigena DSM 20109]|uniref:Pre-toxin TG domain-containing protein n=1 Tax=Cellulomonas flavigena (strain ATCC 482 / DSM 20109 / BCRC 11376 / JCM 18109 / NBRC 3775 / NCIMB 8073 / NRS 134) TaxID=446466 RepID=D5UI68_CELFN|nr:pre-toxin TG domain-containing protein [Cellulomonas flavigena]ADG75413.1 hypothetical protein Cfla_2525 [Cellulomonas flavigena DSM 20109]